MSPALDPEPRTMPPFWLPLLAGLPVGLCLVVMALPELGHGHGTAYRVLYLVAYLLWTVPLTALQRALWHRRAALWATAVILLSVTYAMSVANNVLGVAMAVVAGWGLSPNFAWSRMFGGLEGCWLALIAFCAIHAVVAYYAELKQEQARRLQATSLALDAELRALRYQLHPHFLFNTLNAISSLVTDGRSREATHMLARLGEFLRATLDGGDRHEVTLAEELALTETYLAIEKVRLGDKLRVHWQIGPEILRAQVPYLVLQPLVENAIRHGIALRRDPGALEIMVSREGDRLHLCVRNDGVPTTTANDDVAPGSPRVGLRNVTERLSMLYPGAHAIAAKGRDDGGYEIHLELPFREATTP